MSLRKTRKILLIIGGGLLILQIPWYPVAQIIADRTLTKTTATVIRIDHTSANCTGDAVYGYDHTCDHSDRLYPVYAYYDQQGNRYVQDDRFFGEFKQNNPLRKILGKKVGDTVTAYYTKGKPAEVVFMASLTAYSAWLIPLFIAVPILVVDLVLYLIIRFGK